MAALAAGVLAGAIGGRKALPLLWQTGLVTEPKPALDDSSRLSQEFHHQSGNQTEKQDSLNNPLNNRLNRIADRTTEDRATQDKMAQDKMAQLSQQRLSDVTALANRLFEQWAGILPVASA